MTEPEPAKTFYLEVEVLDERDGVAVPPFGMKLVRVPGSDVKILVSPSRLLPIPAAPDPDKTE